MEVGIAIVVMGAVAVGFAYLSSRWKDESTRSRAESDERDRLEAIQRAEVQAEAASQRETLRRAREPQPSRKLPIREFDPERVVSLKEVESIRMRIRGGMFHLSENQRHEYSGIEYLLCREPKNRHDVNAIAVYFGGKRIGYVSATKAAGIAPLLDQLDADAFLVGGTSTTDNSVKAWVDVPKLPALRSFVKSQTGWSEESK